MLEGKGWGGGPSPHTKEHMKKTVLVPLKEIGERRHLGVRNEQNKNKAKDSARAGSEPEGETQRRERSKKFGD